MPRATEHLQMATLVKRLLTVAGIATTIGAAPVLAERTALAFRSSAVVVSLGTARATPSLAIGSDRVMSSWRLEELRAWRLLQKSMPPMPEGRGQQPVLLANR